MYSQAALLPRCRPPIGRDRLFASGDDQPGAVCCAGGPRIAAEVDVEVGHDARQGELKAAAARGPHQ